MSNETKISYEYRYFHGPHTHGPSGEWRAFFIMRNQHYGHTLAVYNELADEARRLWPKLTDDKIIPGTVDDTGNIDEMAVIEINVESNWPTPSIFRDHGNKLDFKFRR